MDQETQNTLNRRGLLKRIGLASSSALISGKVLANACGITPEQTEGPFYPIQNQVDKNTDLTWVKGSRIKAKGTECFVGGVVQDEFCKPIKGALVEIWQACETGKYNHPADPNTAALDPHFQYWGQAITDENGKYLFKTIIPGAYPAGRNWIRPPHIHFKVHLRGFEELTTQMYWKDHPLNKNDLILQNLPAEERERVCVPFVKKDGVLTGEFNLTLKGFAPLS